MNSASSLPSGSRQAVAPDERHAGVLDTVGRGLATYYLTSLTVLVAVVFGGDFVPLCRAHPASQTRVDWVAGMAAWDGEWYVRIASTGYSYDPERMSSVAFFPLYPVLAWLLVHGLGLRPEWALLIVSHSSLFAAFVLLAGYTTERFPDLGEDVASWALVAFGLFPTTFYFRMAYSESVFVLLAILVLYGMQRNWRAGWIALLVGLATAARTVGVGLIPVFWLYVWQQRATRRGWLLRCAVWFPVCVSGLGAYMTFQWWAFGTPLAFLQTQVHWIERPMGLGAKIVSLLTLEPLRAVYDPTSPGYWGRVPPQGNLLFNLKAANPVYFLATVGLVAIGAWKRWLNAREVLLSAALLAIPYWFQAARAYMSSQARYAAVVFPVYLVLGQLLSRCPAPLAAALLVLSGVFLAAYSALFVSWYWYY
jgi:hypothetical protein